MGPRDQPVRFAVPVNYETGAELTLNQQMHLTRLSETSEELYGAMHDAEGSSRPGEHQDHVFQTRRMAIAGTHLEIALMLARRAALEGK